MGKYDAISQSAAALIARKGSPITLRRVSGGTFNPVTQAITGAATTTATLNGVVLPGGRGDDYQPGTLQRASAIKIIFALSRASVVPQPGDVVSWNGVSWTLLRVSVTDPAGDGPIIAECEAE